MAVRERVRERRVVDDLDPGPVAVDEEERRQPLVAVDDVHHHDVEVGHVARRDEPLLGPDAPAGGRALGRPGDPARVGAGPALGDGVGVGPLAAQRRLQVALDLLGRPPREHVVAAAHVPPDAVGVAAQLLLHEHLLEGRPPLAADVDGVVSADQPELAGPGRDRRRLLGRERPAVPLRLELERDQRLVDEARGALAQVDLSGGQGLHGRVTLPEPGPRALHLGVPPGQPLGRLVAAHRRLVAGAQMPGRGDLVKAAPDADRRAPPGRLRRAPSSRCRRPPRPASPGCRPGTA